jgi:predicted phosphodiesterase
MAYRVMASRIMTENYKTTMLFNNTHEHSQADVFSVCLPDRIGIMADSHGNLASMACGIRHLVDRHVDKIVHLGDIFDSEIHDQLAAIVEMIRRYDILAVKGNNDFKIEKMLGSNNCIDLAASDRCRIGQFLRSLELYFISQDFCFAHSLPYDSIRSFYEPIDTGSTDQAAHVFQCTRHHVLFSGHSHAPVLFRWRSGRITREPLTADVPLCFMPDERYIVIVGAIDRGECGLIDRGKMIYERIRW